jgi:hypothetical protein
MFSILMAVSILFTFVTVWILVFLYFNQQQPIELRKITRMLSEESSTLQTTSVAGSPPSNQRSIVSSGSTGGTQPASGTDVVQ